MNTTMASPRPLAHATPGSPRMRRSLRRLAFGLACLVAPAFAVAGSPLDAGSRGSWTEQKVSAEVPAPDNSFGYAVAVDGDIAVVGEPYGAVAGNSGQGLAHVYVRAGGTWSETQVLVADDGAAGDGFGFSVSISGGTILVGAPYATVGENGGQGAAYAFEESGGSWSQAQKLVTAAGGASNNFGWSVAVSGATAIVSAPVAPVGENALQGNATVFTGDAGSWTEGPTLVADDGTAFATFGSSVAVDGDTIVVGANGVNSYFGAAYVFERSGTDWNQVARLAPDDGTTLEFFGISVAVSGANAIVGAYNQRVGENNGQGSAYVFTRSEDTWTQAQKLVASDGAASARFGLAVAIDGATALVGSYFADVGANVNQGAAYVFRLEGGTWSETDKLVASDGAADENLGNAVALSGDTALTGVLNAEIDGNAGAGAAYFFTAPVADTIFENGFELP